MKLFNALLRRLKKSPKCKADRNDSKGDDSSRTNDSSGAIVSTAVSVKRYRTSNQPRLRVDSKKCAMAKELLQLWNKHDLEGSSKLLSDDFLVVFSDYDLTWKDFSHEVQNLFESFPDFHFDYRMIEERDDVVIVHDLISSGHHTCKPYAFGPCDPIEASGRLVKNDPETVVCFFDKDGKCCKHEVIASGEMTGPAGIYTQLGGFPLM
ncbi:expressed unknown protein [Seminavis robusta]|uniref:SnoaL-like domain-containing protein n=1 Tax=Seminavis robusta TaxID=568900 RepID=A0A9N8E202_9STRA|nr:expressed unknown protein [Seminavis robusta]|eukprot:Sro463_g148330.1 n/a (208) ;mRNA; r:62608-63231